MNKSLSKFYLTSMKFGILLNNRIKSLGSEMRVMIILDKKDMYKIDKLFDGWNETIIWSCLQGYMGKAWVDNIDEPKSAQIIVGDFVFYAGVTNIELVKNIPSYYRKDSILMIPQNNEWGKLIEEVYHNNNDKFFRYAIKKEGDMFEKEILKGYIEGISKEYKIVKIDEKIYNKILKEEWSKDLCSTFLNFSEYEKLGLGFAIIHNDDVVCGASSYTVYDKGIEIEIDTKKEYRRKGLASACASKLIIECLERGIYPSWDAANKESVALSEKLGYYFEKEYITYEITNFR